MSSDNLSSGMSKLRVGRRGSSDRSGSSRSGGRRSSRDENTTTKKVTKQKATKVRRRLSVVAGDPRRKNFAKLDGAEAKDEKKRRKKVSKGGATEQICVIDKFHSSSNVGYVPFNRNKVNQDRACHVIPFGDTESKAFFGVFDGHGSLGHDVSQFVATELPKYVIKQKNLDREPVEAISKAFVDCNSKLAKSAIDVTFSGTTVIVCYIKGTKLYSANAGDSRAVLARSVDGKLQAVPLSIDQKPEREDEAKRIAESNGRVDACKGVNGEDIGPQRVWLLHQDVPGLAMTRSFGDLIAASVGVIARPEVQITELSSDDKFMILASDGVWEFIDSQEAIEIVEQAEGDPELACQLLVEESTKRWREEEEVIDDITALVCYFKAP